MIRRSLVVTFLLFVAGGLFAQVDQYNDDHKKTGLWTVYLDEYTNQVDKEEAIFIGYELYDNGKCVYPFAGYKAKFYTPEFDGVEGEPGHPVLLTGTHKLISKSGKVGYEATYKDGRPIVMKAYGYDKSGVCCMTEILDFQNKLNGIDGTFYYQVYSYDEVRTKGYYQETEKGWRVVEE